MESRGSDSENEEDYIKFTKYDDICYMFSTINGNKAYSVENGSLIKAFCKVLTDVVSYNKNLGSNNFESLAAHMRDLTGYYSKKKQTAEIVNRIKYNTCFIPNKLNENTQNDKNLNISNTTEETKINVQEIEELETNSKTTILIDKTKPNNSNYTNIHQIVNRMAVSSAVATLRTANVLFNHSKSPINKKYDYIKQKFYSMLQNVNELLKECHKNYYMKMNSNELKNIKNEQLDLLQTLRHNKNKLEINARDSQSTIFGQLSNAIGFGDTKLILQLIPKYKCLIEDTKHCQKIVEEINYGIQVKIWNFSRIKNYFKTQNELSKWNDNKFNTCMELLYEAFGGEMSGDELLECEKEDVLEAFAEIDTKNQISKNERIYIWKVIREIQLKCKTMLEFEEKYRNALNDPITNPNQFFNNYLTSKR